MRERTGEGGRESTQDETSERNDAQTKSSGEGESLISS